MLGWVLIGFYFLSSCFLFLGSVFLVRSGEVIARRLKLGDFFLGSVLISLATSLPEMVTSLRSVYLSSYDMALSNIYGSVLFNVMILGLFLFLFSRFKNKKKRCPVDVDFFLKASLLTAFFFFLLILNFFLPLKRTVLRLGWSSLLIILSYFSFIVLTLKKEREEQNDVEPQHQKSLLFHTIIYILCGCVIFFMGSMCVHSLKKFSKMVGLHESFSGFLFLAFATSLPEIVTLYASFKKRSYSLLFGIVGGSNLFNIMIIVLSDFFLKEKAIAEEISFNNVLTACLSFFYVLVVCFLLKISFKKKYLSLKHSSLLISFLYFLFVAILYFFI